MIKTWLFLSFENKMNIPTYGDYSREELISALNKKNKKIDCQRSMLYQSTIRRTQLKTKHQTSIKEIAKLKSEVEKLNQRIERLMTAGRGKVRPINENTFIILNTIMAYFKFKKEHEITNNEIVFLILGYQQEWFFLSDITEFNRTWGRNPDFRWRREFRGYCDAGLFCKDKIGRKTFYFISWRGRERIEKILECLYNNK